MWRSMMFGGHRYIYIYVDKYHGSNPIDIYRYISRHSIVEKTSL